MLRILFLFLLLFCTACGRSAPTFYYTLTSETSLQALSPLPQKTIRLAKVAIPQYLDRQNIVSRKENSVELNVDPLQIWAEPLGDGIRRILQQELTEPLLRKNLLVLPLGSEEGGNFVLYVDVLKFDGALGHNIELIAQWTLIQPSRNVTVNNGIFKKVAKPIDTSYKAFVQTQSILTQQLAQAILANLPTLR
ncbi:MAG: membrane integrity-associated transporter subunit PqiC [Desulfovibrio sp.]|nr:membrane integrity-associated transporter subunit PqiC [Desulfovibrio sp.]